MAVEVAAGGGAARLSLTGPSGSTGGEPALFEAVGAKGVSGAFFFEPAAASEPEAHVAGGHSSPGKAAAAAADPPDGGNALED